MAEAVLFGKPTAVFIGQGYGALENAVMRGNRIRGLQITAEGGSIQMGFPDRRQLRGAMKRLSREA